MSLMAPGEASQNLAKGLKSVRAKMEAILAQVQQEALREKRAKDELPKEHARERAAHDKKKKILDDIQEVEKEVEKIEVKESYFKEKRYYVQRRFDENSKTKQFLERNKVDVITLESTLEEYSEKTRKTMEEIAKMHKTVQSIEKQILEQEKREIVARDNIARLEEKRRSMERSHSSVVMNYTPLSDRQYIQKANSIREMISLSAENKRRMERKADALEKEIVELEKKITLIKKRTTELRQTMNELKGSRI